MIVEPLVSQQAKPTNSFLWAVKSYLDLISRDDPLVYGSGLKRLYSMSSGVATLNDEDIEAITAKSEHLKLIPNNLHGFMVSSILKNIELFGRELQRIINNRIISIANGDVYNPYPLLKYNAILGHRYFYTPPAYFVKRLQKAIIDDTGLRYSFSPPLVTSIQDVSNDVDTIMVRFNTDESRIELTETSWGALSKAVDDLVEILSSETRHAIKDQDYRTRSRPALKILWFIAKLLNAELNFTPQRKDVNLIDLNNKLNLSDGTLASIPFPLKETVNLFSDNDSRGITLKGRIYLSAISAVAFYNAPVEG